MDLTGKTVLISGSTDGIGRETALEAAGKGASVIIHGRNQDKINDTVDRIKQKTGNAKIFEICADFSSLREVSKMSEELSLKFPKIDILINNAAEITHTRILTKDGFERQFQVNYLAHFLLTEKLLSRIKNNKGAKIINISSMIHASTIDFNNLQSEDDYSGSRTYALTKLLNILHTYDLSDRLRDHKVVIHCLHPGVIETKLLNTSWSGGAPLSEGSGNVMYAITSDVTSEMSGLYLENRRPVQSNPISYDKSVQEKLRNISRKLLENYL